MADRGSILVWSMVLRAFLWYALMLLQLKVSFDVAKFQKHQRKEAVKYPKEKFQDKDIKRQLGMYSKLGPPGLPDDKYIKVSIRP